MRRGFWFAVLSIAAMALVIGIGEASAAAPAQAKLSQQVAGGGVSVNATLLKDPGEGTAIKLALETHSVNLDGYSFEAIATLRDGNGKTYPVEAVEKAGGGGHHREAILRFASVSAEAKTIELTVKNVAGVKERIFRWSLAE